MIAHITSPLSFQIAKLSESERAELSKHLDKMGEEFQGKFVQEVDAYLQRPTFYNDKGKVNRCVPALFRSILNL